MRTRNRIGMSLAIFAGLPLCLLLAAGCNKPDDTAGGAAPAGPAASGGPGAGGPGGGGMRGPGGPGGGAPLAENATGEEIMQAKCGCHGPGGKGGRAPNLTKLGSDSDDALFKVIHDGKGKMPAFNTQLKDDQIKKVVAAIKKLTPSD